MSPFHVGVINANGWWENGDLVPPATHAILLNAYDWEVNFAYTAQVAARHRMRGRIVLARSDYHYPADVYQTLVDNVDCHQVQVGNEPDWRLPGEWNTCWARTLEVSPIIRAAGKDVVLAAPFTNQATQYFSDVSTNVWDAVDLIGTHPYAPSASESIALLETWRQLMPARKHFIVDEVGVAVKVRTGSTRLVRGEDGQAAFLSSFAQKLRLVHDRWLCNGFYWYFDQDVANGDGTWIDYCGLRDEWGRPRKAFHRLNLEATP